MASPFASVTSEVIIQIKFCGVFYLTVLGPLHMSPVTGLARLPGRFLWCVHMGNFSPVDWDEFKKHNQNG